MSVFLNAYLPDTDPSSKKQAVDPGLTKQSTELAASPYKLVEAADIKGMLKTRMPFSHKGSYGHALLIAGAQKTMGAAILCAKGCLYAGAGLVSLSIPEQGLTALNSILPEAMYLERAELLRARTLNTYDAIGIGPGIGRMADSQKIMAAIFALKQAVVIDADALAILKAHPDLFHQLPKDAILSPHVKEFDQLFGIHENWWERLQTARKEAKKRGIVIVLKNQYTFIIDHDGDVSINQTGNPAMAQGGMGDVLTGMLSAYLAQGYSAKAAALLACYFHGKSGDELSRTHFNVTASQVALQIPITVKGLANF
ncbi:NAD(P)H-hydrate dehydratase [Pedobacter sp. N36a]|uniref:NAD(P)H-hydrate dehydratase n=1 Tax=Pedobacter sp. N36a TaxID=2767996 RepID=UPI001656D5A1|nr:NAD(P)H-hydrate dehydratase [Pedobacter sp. N36a]MBC8985718.1 NAD(P)H-hydrate dehydratase [Pedobacter sp. N36a]